MEANTPENPVEQARKVLIIEDDELVAGMYKRKFETAGFEVHVEMDGSEGYYRISQLHPDAVLLDLLLPGMDGPVIIGKFRAQPKFRDLPFIVFTNAYLSDAGRAAIKAGATKVFNKATASPREIVAAVEEALRRTFPAPLSPSQPAPQPLPSPDDPTMLSVLATPPFSANPAPQPAPASAPGNTPETATASAPAKRNWEEEYGTKPEAPDSSLTKETAAAPVKTDDVSFDQGNSEQTFLLNAVQSFLQKSETRLAALRHIVTSLQVDAGKPVNTQSLLDMARIAHLMSSNAAIIGLYYLGHLSAALEALAWELFEKPSKFSLPTQKTMARAIDTMARLIAGGSSFQLKEFSRFNVLVVDDHRIARTTVNKALDRVNLSHVATGRPELALELLQENAFELAILDVKMEGMSGIELCKELRKLPHQEHCRVLFVSGLKDVQSWGASIQAGGNDYILKPFVPMELALKALLHMIDSQLGQYPSEEKPEGNAPAQSPKAEE